MSFLAINIIAEMDVGCTGGMHFLDLSLPEAYILFRIARISRIDRE